MRERIYTIPLTEVVIPGQGCPFCLLAARAEPALLHVYLDGLLVDVEWRGRVIESWLCRRHLAGLQMETRKLGGAIVAQALLTSALTALGNAARDAPLPAWGSTCLACQEIERTIVHHVESFLLTWLAEPEFRQSVARADPFCLPHLALIHRQADRLPRRRRAPLRAELLRLEEATLRPLLDKVDWFVRKHDARFKDEPWDGAEDAVERAVGVLTGW